MSERKGGCPHCEGKEMREDILQDENGAGFKFDFSRISCCGCKGWISDHFIGVFGQKWCLEKA